MDDRRFDIVFSGQIVEGTEPGAVLVRLAELFKADQAKVQELFSGNRYTLKKDLDAATARKFQAVLEKAGAVCELAERHEGGLNATIAPPGSLLTEYITPPPPAIDISALALMELGVDVLDDYSEPQPLTLDLSAMTLAPAGETLVAPVIQKVQLPPVRQFTIAEVGALLGEATPRVAMRTIPDGNHLTLAPVGANLGGDDN